MITTYWVKCSKKEGHFRGVFGFETIHYPGRHTVYHGTSVTRARIRYEENRPDANYKNWRVECYLKQVESNDHTGLGEYDAEPIWSEELPPPPKPEIPKPEPEPCINFEPPKKKSFWVRLFGGK